MGPRCAGGGRHYVVKRRLRSTDAVQKHPRRSLPLPPSPVLPPHAHANPSTNQVVFRNGSTLNTTDLVNAACETARSIVVMSVGDNSAQADANTLRVVLALMVRINAREHRLESFWDHRRLRSTLTHAHALCPGAQPYFTPTNRRWEISCADSWWRRCVTKT